MDNINNKPSDVVLSAIKDIIKKESGISFTGSHLKVLEQRVVSTMRHKNCSDIELLNILKGNPIELHAFIGFTTTNHTYFFRSIEQFHILGTVILPELIQLNAGTKIIRLWSAACSSGEEPYSLALYIKHYLEINNLSDWSFQILATDIDETTRSIGERGIYSAESLRHIPKEYQQYIERLPVPEEIDFPAIEQIEITNEIKKHILFKPGNLINDIKAPIMDIIFCRNVLIYFDEKTQELVVNNLTKNLRPNGFFFVSPSETITELDTQLEVIICPKVIYYRKKD